MEKGVGLDEVTKNRIDVAWKCVLSQYLDYAKNISMEEGPGMSVFKFLRKPKEDNSNCQYLYTEKDGDMWKEIINFSPLGEKLQEFYNPVSMIAICVHVPIGTYGEQTIGNFRLFHRESHEEITTVERTDEHQEYEWDDNPDKDCGIRKRNVPQN